MRTVFHDPRLTALALTTARLLVRETPKEGQEVSFAIDPRAITSHDLSEWEVELLPSVDTAMVVIVRERRDHQGMTAAERRGMYEAQRRSMLRDNLLPGA